MAPGIKAQSVSEHSLVL